MEVDGVVVFVIVALCSVVIGAGGLLLLRRFLG